MEEEVEEFSGDNLKLKVTEKSDRILKFDVDDISPSLAGELRHIMISEVPTMSIEVVDFHKNDSFLWNEILASRLGLVPLTHDQKYHKPKDACTCKGKRCPKCQVTLVIKKKGPGVVLSSDLKSSDNKVKPVFDKIPLTELLEGQEMEIEAYAEIGIGRDHAKWQGSVVGYNENKGKYSFFVESASGLGVKEIMSKSLEILNSKLKDFSSDVGKLK